MMDDTMNQAAIRLLSDGELDQVSGGNFVSTVVNTAVATARLVEGLVGAYVNGLIDYTLHTA